MQRSRRRVFLQREKINCSMWEKYFHNLYLFIVNYRPKFMGYERDPWGTNRVLKSCAISV